MKVKLYIDNGRFCAGYTETLLRGLLSAACCELVEDVRFADLLLVSMCDPVDLHLLVEARRECTGQSVVMGGFEGFFGEPYLAWADAVVVGEGFEFFDSLKKKGWDELPCVLMDDRTAIASYKMEWEKLPLVRTGMRKAYFLAGRGCHNKCTFCATSWVQPYQKNTIARLRRAAAKAKSHGCKVTFICNDSSDMPRLKGVNAASVTVRDYLRNPAGYKCNLLHFGVEAWNEAERRKYGKPIGNNDLVALIEATKEHKQRCELFFIAGREGWNLNAVRELVKMLPQDTWHLPAMHVKLTYFDPCPHTPLAKACPATEFVDTCQVFSILNSHNKRFRVFPVRSLARSNWRTVLHRCTPEQAMTLGPEPKDTNIPGSRGRFLLGLKRKGLDHLAHAVSVEPCGRIRVNCRSKD